MTIYKLMNHMEEVDNVDLLSTKEGAHQKNERTL